jgi:hypothetical protein
VQHVDRPAANRRSDRVGARDYRRRVSITRRAHALLFLGLVAAIVVGGCGSKSEATGFCAAIEKGNTVFDSPDSVATDKAALREFDRIVASAPPAVAPDLKVVSAALHDPHSLTTSTARLQRYFTTTVRVDRYLHDTCGVKIPKRANI